jgi:hypothetical protein
MALYLTVGRTATRSDTEPKPPTRADEELAIDVDLEEIEQIETIEDLEDKEATARLPPDETQRLIDAAFPERL